MKRTLLVLACAALFAAVMATAQVTVKEEPVTWSQVAIGDGESLFTELCAVCHGTDGKGNGPAVEALTVPPPDLTMLAKMNDGVFPAERVSRSIRGAAGIAAHGTREMPIWGAIFREVRPDYKMVQKQAFAEWRIGNLTSYVETIQVD